MMTQIEQSASFSVSELNRMIAETLKRDPRLKNIKVTAEISGFKAHFATGHWYFTLKDREASIPCAMFRQYTYKAQIKPADGDMVTVTGYVDFYSPSGRTQIIVTSLSAAGSGSILEQFEALKRKLGAEGLFDPDRKKLLPRIPRKVAVVTSASGKAIHDILNVSYQRDPAIPITLIPSSVQGEGAAEEIVEALFRAAAIPDVDVIILARGGGSMEDLWCFNSESIARAIAASPLPVVTGIGHETDFTIADFVADARASTPSNAAELVFPDRQELRSLLQLKRTELCQLMMQELQRRISAVHELQLCIQRVNPERTIHVLLDRTHQAQAALVHYTSMSLRSKKNAVDADISRLNHAADLRVSAMLSGINALKNRLDAIDPLKVLERGYAVVYDDDNCIVSSAEEAARKTSMILGFKDGMVSVQRKEI